MSEERSQHDQWPSEREGYQIRELIGSGRFAKVFKAWCPEKEAYVAIRELHLDQVEEMDEVKKEIQVLRRCLHPNILRYRTSLVSGEHLWLVTEFMDVGSSLDLMKVVLRSSNSRFDVEAVVAAILKQALTGLKYFHSNGEIHRNIKASNLLVNREGVVKLADFGDSNWLMEGGNRKKKVRTMAGSLNWMAPEVMEQVAGYNEKCDIWSVGITALELLLGKPPYYSEHGIKVMMKILKDPPPTLRALGTSRKYGSSVHKFIEACLKKDPAERPSAEELLDMSFLKKAKKPEKVLMEVIQEESGCLMHEGPSSAEPTPSPLLWPGPPPKVSSPIIEEVSTFQSPFTRELASAAAELRWDFEEEQEEEKTEGGEEKKDPAQVAESSGSTLPAEPPTVVVEAPSLKGPPSVEFAGASSGPSTLPASADSTIQPVSLTHDSPAPRLKHKQVSEGNLATGEVSYSNGESRSGQGKGREPLRSIPAGSPTMHLSASSSGTSTPVDPSSSSTSNPVPQVKQKGRFEVATTDIAASGSEKQGREKKKSKELQQGPPKLQQDPSPSSRCDQQSQSNLPETGPQEMGEEMGTLGSANIPNSASSSSIAELAPQTVQKGRFEVTSTDYSNIKKSESQVSNKGGGDGSRSGYGGGGQAWAASYPKNVLEQHQVLLDYLCSQSQQHTWMLQSLMQKLGVEGGTTQSVVQPATPVWSTNPHLPPSFNSNSSLSSVGSHTVGGRRTPAEVTAGSGSSSAQGANNGGAPTPSMLSTFKQVTTTVSSHSRGSAAADAGVLSPPATGGEPLQSRYHQHHHHHHHHHQSGAKPPKVGDTAGSGMAQSSSSSSAPAATAAVAAAGKPSAATVDMNVPQSVAAAHISKSSSSSSTNSAFASGSRGPAPASASASAAGESPMGPPQATPSSRLGSGVVPHKPRASVGLHIPLSVAHHPSELNPHSAMSRDVSDVNFFDILSLMSSKIQYVLEENQALKNRLHQLEGEVRSQSHSQPQSHVSSSTSPASTSMQQRQKSSAASTTDRNSPPGDEVGPSNSGPQLPSPQRSPPAAGEVPLRDRKSHQQQRQPQQQQQQQNQQPQQQQQPQSNGIRLSSSNPPVPEGSAGSPQ